VSFGTIVACLLLLATSLVILTTWRVRTSRADAQREAQEAEQRRHEEAHGKERLKRHRERAERVAAHIIQAAKTREEAEARLRREEEEDQHAVTELIVGLRDAPRYEDPEFLRACADRLLEDDKRVLRTIQSWDVAPGDAPRQLQDLHKHPRRVAILQERAPEIYQRLLWKVKLREIVERHVAMGGAASRETRPSVKLTVETFREKKLKRVVVAADDQLGFERTLHERLRMAREAFTAMALSEDEIEGSLRAIEASMREEAAQVQNRGGSDVQQL